MYTRVIRGFFVLGILTCAVSIGIAQDEGEQAPPPQPIITNIWVRSTAAPMAMDMMGMDAAETTEEPMEMNAEATEEATVEVTEDVTFGTSAAYMTIENPGDTDIVLTAVRSSVTPLVELHETRIENDIASMSPVEGGVLIPAGGMVELQPGGLHIMLIDLMVELVAGEAVGLALEFETEDAFLDVILGAPILEEAPPSSRITIANAWARPLAPQSEDEAATTAVFMTMTNYSEDEVELVGISTSIAANAEIQETVVEDDIAAMADVVSLTLAPEGTITLRPESYQITLTELEADLEQGDVFALTLSFASGEELVIGVPVYDRELLGLDVSQ